jgi:hypothetical protein
MRWQQHALINKLSSWELPLSIETSTVPYSRRRIWRAQRLLGGGGSLNTHDEGRGGGKYRSCQKHVSLSPHDIIFIDNHLLNISSITSLKLNLCTSLTIQNNNCFITHARTTPALQRKLFLTGMYLLVVTDEREPHFLTAHNSQSQLATPQSRSVQVAQHNIYSHYKYDGGVLNV